MTILFSYFSAAVLVVAAFAGIAPAQTRISGPCIDHFGQAEWALLLETVPSETKAKFIDNPEVRKQQTDNLTQLFAYACYAVKSGIASEKINAIELKNIRSESLAVGFDREVAKSKDGPAFARITAAQVTRFYASRQNVTAFDEFLATKIAMLRRLNPQFGDRELTEDEKQQAREMFAKIKISEGEYLRSTVPGSRVRARSELQARLQQAQFLAQIATDAIASELVVSDAELDRYIAGHPEFDTSKKRELATTLLDRAKAGEDFAALADRYTDDPGNSGDDGVKHGGLYSGIAKGVFVPPFETAALSLKAGQLYPSLVETDFGYHIIKLERVSGGPSDMTYDVRHILISTGVKDPVDPSGRETPVREYVKTTLATEKETKMGQRILEANPVVVEDYARPTAAVKKKVVRKRR